MGGFTWLRPRQILHLNFAKVDDFEIAWWIECLLRCPQWGQMKTI